MARRDSSTGKASDAPDALDPFEAGQRYVEENGLRAQVSDATAKLVARIFQGGFAAAKDRSSERPGK